MRAADGVEADNGGCGYDGFFQRMESGHAIGHVQRDAKPRR